MTNLSDDKAKSLIEDFNKVGLGADAFSEQMKVSDQALINYLRTADKGNATFSDFKNSMKQTTFAAKAGSVAMQGLTMVGNMAINMLAGIAIEALVTGIYNLVTATERAIEKGEEAKSKITEVSDSFTDTKSTISDLGKQFADSEDTISNTGDAISSVAEKYEELSKGVNSLTNQNYSLSDDDYAEYVSLSNQLAELFPTLVTGYDGQGNALLNLGNGAQSAAEQLQSLLDTQRKMANYDIGQELSDAYKGTVASAGKIEDELAQYNDLKEKADTAYDKATSQTSVDSILSQLESGNITLKRSEFDNYSDVADIINKSIVDNAGFAPIRNTWSEPDPYDPYGLGDDGITISIGAELDEETLTAIKEDAEKYLEKDADSSKIKSNEYANQIAALELQLQDEWQSMTSSISSFLQTSDAFSGLSDELQGAFLSNLDGIDISSVSNDYGGDIKKFIYGEFLQPMDELTPEAQDKLGNLLQLDRKSMKLLDYKEQVNSVFDSVFDTSTEAGQKARDSMYESLGFEKSIDEMTSNANKLKSSFHTNNRTVQDYAKDIMGSFVGFSDFSSTVKDQGKKDFSNWIDGLSQEDLETVYNLKLDTDTATWTLEDWIYNLEQAKREAEEPIDLKATPQLDAYEDATSSENAGDNYVKMAEGLETAKELYDKGLVGTDDFKTYAAMISPTGSDDAANFEENLAKFERYFDTDSHAGVENFLNDLQSNGFADFTTELDENGNAIEQWKYNIEDLEDAAQQMGMGFEPFMAMFGRLEDYGFSNNMISSVEDGVTHITDLYSNLADEEAHLAEITAPGDYETSEGMTVGNQTAIDASKAKIEELKSSIQETQGYMDQLVAKSVQDIESEVNAGKAAIESLQQEKEKLDPSSENYDSVVKVIDDQIGDLAEQYHIEIPVEQTVENPEEAKEKIEAAGNAQIEAEIVIPETQPQVVDLPTTQEINQNIFTTFDADNSEVLAKADEAENYANSKEPKETIDGDNAPAIAAADAAASHAESLNPVISIGGDASGVSSAINSALSGSFSINVHANITGTSGLPALEGKRADGNAHAQGTPIIKSSHFNNGVLGKAFAKGTWGEARDTDALTGELGQELVVRGNKFFTVGDNGPEMAHLKSGDIVFNHLQTHEILTKGYTSGRGKALFNGNALANGNARAGILGGGGNFQGGASSSSTSSGNTAVATNTAAQAANTAATEDNTKATEDSKKVYDNIARKIEVAVNKAKEIAASITDYITFAKKSSLLNKQMKANTNTISVNEKSYSKYMAKANSFGLSEDWKKKIQNGEYSIDELDTSTDEGKALQEQIDNYQEYYDKAQDCKSAIAELKREQEELYEQWANVPIEAYEKKLEKLSDKLSVIDASSDAASTATGAKILAKSQKTSAKTDLKAAKSQKKTTNKVVKNEKKDVKKALKKSNLSKTKQKKITAQMSSNKKISTKGLKGDVLKQAKEYNNSLKIDKTAKKAVTSAQSAYDTATSNAKLANSTDATQSYKVQNSLLNQELKNEQKTAKAANTAKKKTTKQAAKTTKQMNTAGNKLAGSKNLTKKQQNRIAQGKTISTKGLKGKDLENAKKYNELVKKNNAALKAQAAAANTAAEAQANLAAKTAEVANQQMENIKAGYDSKNDLLSSASSNKSSARSLKETQGKQLTANDYKAEATAKAAEKSNLQAEQKALQSKLNSLVSSGKIKKNSEEYNQWMAQINALTDSINECDASIIDLNRSAQEVTVTNLENALSILESATSVLSSKIEYLQALGQDLTKTDYTSQIEKNTAQYNKQNEIRAAYQALANAERAAGNTVKADEYQKQADAAQSSMYSLLATNEELKDSMRSDIYFRDFVRAREAINALRNGIESISDLITNDMMYDKDGFLTKAGLAKQSMLISEYQSYADDLQTAMDEIAQIEALKGSDGYSEQEYLEDLRAAEEKLQEAIKGEASAREAVLETVKNQLKAELDALNEIIDARKEALQKKKDYYDYDKTLKSKTKEINLLKQQIAALDGVTDAESRAKKARLEAQLAEAEEELEDTIFEHKIDLQVEGLDDLKEQLQETYDDYVKELSSNLEAMEAAFDSVKNTVTCAANSISDTISSILKSYGVSDSSILSSDASSANITGFASGGLVKAVRKNGDDGIASLKNGETVLDAELTKLLTESLPDLTHYYSSIAPKMSDIFTPDVINPEVSFGNIEINVDAAGQDGDGIARSITEAIKQEIPSIAKFTINEIAKDARKGGIKAKR